MLKLVKPLAKIKTI